MLKGIYTLKHYRDNKLINTYIIDNMITVPCLNAMLDGLFNSISPPTGNINGYSYCGIIDSINFTELSKFDLLFYHPGWQEYGSGLRAVNNSGISVAYTTNYEINMGNYSIIFTKDGIILGVFICNNPNVGGDGEIGLLMSTAIYSTSIPCHTGDILTVNYKIYMNSQPGWVEDLRP